MRKMLTFLFFAPSTWAQSSLKYQEITHLLSLFFRQFLKETFVDEGGEHFLSEFLNFREAKKIGRFCLLRR